jgi:hypothetical protein
VLSEPKPYDEEISGKLFMSVLGVTLTPTPRHLPYPSPPSFFLFYQVFEELQHITVPLGKIKI